LWVRSLILVSIVSFVRPLIVREDILGGRGGLRFV
jgi:hypothetical protein